MSTNRMSLIALVCLAALTSACGSDSSPAQPSPPDLGPGIDATVRIKGSAFSPSPLQLRVGQTVNWLNEDSIEHTATLPGVYDTGKISPTSAHGENGDQYTFRTAGTFTFRCMLHQESGTIVVQ